jgi:CBS domain-containing protein
MLVRDAMTKNAVSVKPDDTLEYLLDLLSKSNISGCPVVSRKNVVGVISQTDILKLIDVHSKIQTPDSGLFPLILAVIRSEHYDSLKEALKDILNLKVKDFMSKTVVTINADEDIYTAARLMNKNDVNRLPVLDEKKFVGIIARGDIIKALDKLGK